MATIPAPATGRIILIPAIVTLGVTLVRLTGELLGWSPALFSREPGGGGSLFGIWLLVPIFGVYFALRLMRAGQPPASGWRVALRALLALVAGVAAVALVFQVVTEPFLMIGLVGFLFLLLPVLLLRSSWPALYSTLISYALAARLPVAAVMFFAIMGDWGTHYDGPPPDFPASGPIVEWLMTGLFPQLTFWVGFTVIVGMLCGGVAAGLKSSSNAAR